jgi:predicted phosphodiesterase
MEEGPTLKRKLRIVAVSDTHDKQKHIEQTDWPEADIFIHAGDFTRASRAKEFERFRTFLKNLPYKHKIVIPGNHDFGVDPINYEKVSEHWGIKPKERVVP